MSLDKRAFNCPDCGISIDRRQKLCIVIYVAENYIITTDTISGSLPATQEKYTFGVMKNTD